MEVIIFGRDYRVGGMGVCTLTTCASSQVGRFDGQAQTWSNRTRSNADEMVSAWRDHFLGRVRQGVGRL